MLEFEVHALGDNSDNGSSSEDENWEFEEFDPENYGRLKSSIEERVELELKPLLEHLEYAFLAEGSKLPVIIALNLTAD